MAKIGADLWRLFSWEEDGKRRWSSVSADHLEVTQHQSTLVWKDTTPVDEYTDYIGDIVLYKLAEGPSAGHTRPAIVVRQWGPAPTRDGQGPALNVVVFTDSSNDNLPPAMSKNSVTFGDGIGQYAR